MAALTRRQFLDLVAGVSAAASFASAALLTACSRTADRPSALGLGRNGTRTLIALIDELIPAADGKPAASQVGTLAYFELLAANEKRLTTTAQDAIRSVDAISGERFGRPFADVDASGRIAVVSELARDSQALFSQLRVYVYEGYYLDAKVWEGLAYEPFPTHLAGPTMTPFDAALVDRVREMPSRYRQA